MDFWQQLTESKESGKPFVLCVITATKGSSPRKAGSKMIVFHDRSIHGTIGGGKIEFQAISDAIEIMTKGVPVTKSYELEEDLGMHCGGQVDVYFEPVNPTDKLFIFGAGHIGRVVARYGLDMGFRVSIFDERPSIFNEFDNSKFECITDEYSKCVANATFDDRTYIVIVTPGHKHDEDVLAACANKTHAYIGMIGSNRKVAETKKRFLEEKLLTKEQLDGIDMPIGIKFNAETPEEIAISIIAKLIDVRNSRK